MSYKKNLILSLFLFLQCCASSSPLRKKPKWIGVTNCISDRLVGGLFCYDAKGKSPSEITPFSDTENYVCRPSKDDQIIFNYISECRQ